MDLQCISLKVWDSSEANLQWFGWLPPEGTTQKQLPKQSTYANVVKQVNYST